MSLVNVQGLSLSYGKKVLFDDAGFSIGPRDRVGLVGANGTGKSTLLKILAGQVTADGGSLTLRRGARLGYLPQELVAAPEGCLLESVLAAVPGRDELSRRQADSEAQLAEACDEQEQLELAQRLADLHEELEHFDARHGPRRARMILNGLGFAESDFQRPVAQLSGGWRMRAALAGLLLQQPDLLMLDEPTNHLDLPTLAWFEEFLRRSSQALVLISHDREFLNRQIGRVVSLEVEGVRTYAGNYDEDRRLRAIEREQLIASSQRQQARRAEIQAFVDRFRAKATKASQAQSRIKMLEREEIIQVQQERSTVRFSFPPVVRSGREVARFEGVRKSFGERVVYSGLDAQLLRGERVAVVGPNGSGKTTLLKLLAGELPPEAGAVTWGHNVSVAYYAQHHAEALDPTSTVLDEIAALVPDKTQGWVRGVLGAFLFSGDDVEKRIGVLSGGEKARVALARLLVRPGNLLVMDEPTNHLDLDSSEALIDALRRYDGTLIFVSHNRSFLNALATQVWDVREQKVVPYPGNLDEYLEHLRLLAVSSQSDDTPSAAEAELAKDARSRKEQRRVEAEARQRRSVVQAPLKRQVAQLEAKIGALEAEQKAREALLSDPAFFSDFERARPVMDAHRVDREELEQLYAAWEDAQRQLSESEA